MVTDVNPDVPSEEIQRRASAGHLREELELARDYYTGRGVSRDLSQAAYWYRRAADQGDPGAQVDMGYLYLKGIGVKPDAAQAAKWFQRAASSGSPTGKLDLAVLYLKGIGVPQDSHLALTLLTDLAKHEDARGEAYLGFLYMLGVGAERNPRDAEHWFEKAAKHHSPEAEYAMGTLFSVTEGHEHDLQRAAGISARVCPGWVCTLKAFPGTLIGESPRTATESGRGTVGAGRSGRRRLMAFVVVLGILYRDGKGVPKDTATACRWFIIAGKQGGDKTQAYVHGEIAAAKAALSVDQQQEAENSAEQWVGAHPNKDVFLNQGGSESAFFPIDEVYSTELARVNSSTGASIR